ncbi:MarR family transcriptional regulator [bacterium]|nr:MAG: MarR family transcriptional regulator [bacterium]
MAKPAQENHRRPTSGCAMRVPIPDEIFDGGLEEYQGFDRLAIQTILALKVTAHRLENCAGEWFDEYGLTPAKLNVLICLRAHGERAMRLSEVGDYLFSTRANVTGLVDGLERDGLVQRSANPGDRRSTLVTLTAKGLDLMAQMLPKHFSRVRRITSGLPPAEQRQLIALLAKLFDALATLDESNG